VGSIPDDVIAIFNSPRHSSRTTVLGLTQPVTEMGARNLSGSKARSERKADNLTLSMSRLSRKCGSLDVSQPYSPRRLVTGIASHLPYCLLRFV
jgi:hypothetical protein